MLRISFINKNIRKKLKVLVAFLSGQIIGGQLGLLPHSIFLKSRSKVDQNNYFENSISSASHLKGIGYQQRNFNYICNIIIFYM